MEKLVDFVLLIFFAFGSAIIFTVAVIWKFIQALFEIAFGSTPAPRHVAQDHRPIKHLH